MCLIIYNTYLNYIDELKITKRKLFLFIIARQNERSCETIEIVRSSVTDYM